MIDENEALVLCNRFEYKRIALCGWQLYEYPYLKSHFLFIHPSTKGGAIMQLLTHIIFVLNLLKTLINHFF